MKKFILFLLFAFILFGDSFRTPGTVEAQTGKTKIWVDTLRISYGAVWTNITDLLSSGNADSLGGNWKVFYTNGSGTLIKLSLGAAGTVLKSNGASSAPTFQSDATGAGGSAYADSLVHDGRRVIGDSLITDAEGALRFQPLDAQLTDLADGTLTGDFVSTAYPWSDNEIADNITASNYLLLSAVNDSVMVIINRSAETDLDTTNLAAAWATYVSNHSGSVSNEAIQDLVGAMVTSNTETNISVSYEDGDGTLDFVVSGVLPLTSFDDSLGLGTKTQARGANLDSLNAVGNWKVFYTNGSNVLQKLALGANGTVLKSNGATSAPSWQTDATGAGGAAYADSITHDGRRVIGDSVILDAEGAARFQPLEATLTDIADGTIIEDLTNTTNPWSDSEVADDISLTNITQITNKNITSLDGAVKVMWYGDPAGSIDTARYLYAKEFPRVINAGYPIIDFDFLRASSFRGGTPTDEYALTYEATGDSFQWAALSGGAGDMMAANFDDSLAAPASDEIIQDLVGAMVTSNTETGISVTYEDGDGTFDFVVSGFLPLTSFDDSLGATTSDEIISDFIGTMVTGNTETNITVSYQDADNTLDFVVTGGASADSGYIRVRLDTLEALSGAADKFFVNDTMKLLKPITGISTIDLATVDDYLVNGNGLSDSLLRVTTASTTYLQKIDFADSLDLGVKVQAYDAQLADIADGTFTGDFVNTANPWADNEVADNITASSYLLLTLFDDSISANESRLEGLLDLNQLQGTITDAQIADGAVDGGTGGEIADASITAADLATDAVSADELNATGVESELEAVLDLAQLQGELTPDNIQSAGQVDEYMLTYETTGDSLQWTAIAGGGDMMAAAFDDSLAAPVSDEIIADFVGTMITGNTETGIAVTYEDGDNTLDFVISGYLTLVLFDDSLRNYIPTPGTNPTTSANGQIANDTDDAALEFFDGTASRILPARQIGNYTILFPDSVRARTDDVVFAHFPAEIYPFGITIFYLAISTNPASSDTHVIEEWSDAVGTSQGTTESLALSSANKVESASIDDGAIDADDYLNINLDDATDNIHELIITVGYYVNPGD